MHQEFGLNKLCGSVEGVFYWLLYCFPLLNLSAYLLCALKWLAKHSTGHCLQATCSQWPAAARLSGEAPQGALL